MTTSVAIARIDQVPSSLTFVLGGKANVPGRSLQASGCVSQRKYSLMLQLTLVVLTTASYCKGFVLPKPSVALRRCSTLRMLNDGKGDVKEDLKGGSSGRKMVLQLSSDGENRQQIYQDDDDDGSQNGRDAFIRDVAEEDVNAAEAKVDAAEAKVDAAEAKVDAAKQRLYEAQNVFLKLDADVDAETDERTKKRKQMLANFAEQNVTSAQEDLNIAQQRLSNAEKGLSNAEKRLSRLEEGLSIAQTEQRQETRIRFVMPLDHNVINYTQEFEDLASNVNTVNHGEFENAIEELLHQVEGKDLSESRQNLVAIQRCRRGGKTFMLHAIASLLQQEEHKNCKFKVLYISLNDSSPYAPRAENAMDGILGRIAWELSGRLEEFPDFKDKYSDFMAVRPWLAKNNVILLIDELNVIRPKDERYDEMSIMLSLMVGREGSGLLFSTHRRSTAEFICYRGESDLEDKRFLSQREIVWAKIPRIQNKNCLKGLKKGKQNEKSFWSAVLRGRIPALMVQSDDLINNYGEGIFDDESDLEERRLCLSAAITGNIEGLRKEWYLFPAYSYKSERFVIDKVPSYAWPPFMLANRHVLGKDSEELQAALREPLVSESKAFEALVELAVFLRMLSGEDHDLVPMNVKNKRDCHKKSEIYHIGKEVKNVLQVINRVQKKFGGNEEAQQVLAIPLDDAFPTYDFFLLHKNGDIWKIAAGYQCKSASEYPAANDKVDENVPLSVWIEGKSKKYRISDKKNVQMKEQNGWTLLGQAATVSLLGVSVSEALPQEDLFYATNCCDAARSVANQ